GLEVGREAIQCGAIGADDLVVIAEIEKHMRMIERRIGAHAHEFLRADLDHRNSGIVVEVRDDMIGHRYSPWMAMTNGCNQQTRHCEMPRTILGGKVDS